MTSQKIIQVRDVKLSNENSFALVGGLNVLESESIALRVAETFRSITDKLRIPFIFKASFDKANRSSINSFRGPGLDEGLKILEKIKSEFDVPILTDIHEPFHFLDSKFTSQNSKSAVGCSNQTVCVDMFQCIH